MDVTLMASPIGGNLSYEAQIVFDMSPRTRVRRNLPSQYTDFLDDPGGISCGVVWRGHLLRVAIRRQHQNERYE
jgi:hypothetical protein